MSSQLVALRLGAQWLLLASGLTAILFALSIIGVGERTVGVTETIHGIPYPVSEEGTLILEPLAHLDVYLQEPVFAKQLVIQFEYMPRSVQELAVGVRENSFWLSYPRHIFYRAETGTGADSVHQAIVYLPLTRALQDSDRSIDVMFFADGIEDDRYVRQLGSTTTQWELKSLTTRVEYLWPSWDDSKDYIRSVISRERPL